MKIRTLTVVFACLFILSIYSTWSNVTNLSVMDLDDWLSSDDNVTSLKGAMMAEKDIGVEDKSLHVKKAQQRYVSTSTVEKPETLAETLNLTQYPTKTVVATGYTAGAESTGKSPEHPEYGITFSGVEVKRDLYSTIAADLDVYPIGTVLFIPDYGYGVVADKGSAIEGNEIDLYFPTVESVYKNWGKKTVDVYMIKEGNGSITEEELVRLNENHALQVFRNQILEK